MPDVHVGIVRFENDDHVERLTQTLARLARARVGISPTYLALPETAIALRYARIALASTPAGTPHVTRFDDYPLAVAAVSAPDAMDRVCRAVLGPVLDLPAEQRDLLLATLAGWRDNAGSATATARVMYCHPNTIRHRLRRIETATGRSLADPKAAAAMAL